MLSDSQLQVTGLILDSILNWKKLTKWLNILMEWIDLKFLDTFCSLFPFQIIQTFFKHFCLAYPHDQYIKDTGCYNLTDEL